MGIGCHAVEAHTLIMAESTERQEPSYPTPLKKRHRGLTSHLARATCIVPESAPTPRQTTPPKPHYSGVDEEEEEPLSQGGTEVSRGEEAVVATPAAAQSSPQSAGVTPAAAAGSSGRRSTCRRRRASEICATSERLPPPGTRVFVDVPDLLRCHLTCAMCNDILLAPVSVMGRCQHVFCQHCILSDFRALKAGSSGGASAACPDLACPTCQAPLPAPAEEAKLLPLLYPSLIAGNMLNGLEVYCRWGLERVEGRWVPGKGKHLCPAVLRVGDVAAHEAEGCPHESVLCHVPGCGAVLLKRLLSRHMRDHAGSHVEALLSENSTLQAELSETGNELEEALGRVEALEEELASVKWKACMWDAQGGEAGASCSPADVVPRKRARSQGCSPSSLKLPGSAVKRVQPLKDGYRWRKYGEKTVNGLATPRSYYRCSQAGCPARKMVEEVEGEVQETLKGEHNHSAPLVNNQ